MDALRAAARAMNEEPEPVAPVITLVEPPPAAGPLPRKGWPILSWVAILGFVVGILALRVLFAPAEPGAAGPASLAERIDLKAMQMHMQCLFAAWQLGMAGDAEHTYQSVAAGADSDPAKRLRVSAFAAQMVGPQEALRQLDAVADAQGLSPDERRLCDVLRRLYRDQQHGQVFHPSVNDADVQWLHEQLGWFANAALYPPKSDDVLEHQAAAAGDRASALLDEYHTGRAAMHDRAMQMLLVAVIVVAVVLSVLAAGFIALPVFLFLWMIGVVRVGLKPGIAHGGVYAETFALWLLFYGGLLIGGDLVLHDVPSVVRGVVAMPLSLVFVFWPVLRGVPWRQVRQDIGWTIGRRPLLEPFCGWASYLANVPVMVIGFILTITLAAGYAQLHGATGGGAPPPPTHPVLEQFTHPDPTTLVLTFFLMSVVAPVVEETMFRGFLHRHLREVLFTRRPLLGGVSSALVVNVIFAAIHPQGVFFIPVLAALACGFSLAREWRGTLLPSMFAHGTHNFMQGVLALLLLGT
jgi:membrane protease YdiL (CAAX protease family)